MLAEGIMLYLLIVRVFGRAAEKWYYLLILGWGEHMHVAPLLVATECTATLKIWWNEPWY